MSLQLLWDIFVGMWLAVGIGIGLLCVILIAMFAMILLLEAGDL